MVAGTRECPNCGLVIKVDDDLEKCPVCGEDIPPPRFSSDAKEKDGPVSLEKVIYGSGKAGRKNELREIWNVTFISFFLMSILRWIFVLGVSALIGDEETSTIPFNPVVTFLNNTIIALIAVYPVVYLIISKKPFATFGLTVKDVRKFLFAILVGLGSGILLYLLDAGSQIMNDAIYTATGWEFFNASNPELASFLSESFLNKLFLSVGFILSSALPEILLRGVIQKRLEEIMLGKGKAKSDHAKVFMYSFLLNSFIYIGIYFTPMVIFFSLFSNLLLTALYKFVKSVHACMVAQIIYVIIAVFLF